MAGKDELNLTVGPEEKISPFKAFILGLQHVLAMDVYIAPFVMAGILALSVEETAFFIQMTFVAAGVATILQAGFGIRMPVMQGPSYVPIGALAAIGKTAGLAAMFGSLLPGAFILAFIGRPLKVFSKMVRFLVPPLVGGTVIIVVGIALMPVALKGCYGYFGDTAHNAIVAGVSGISLALLTVIGSVGSGPRVAVRMSSVIISLALGCLTASFYGMLDFSPVGKAAWIALPAVFHYGIEFDMSAILTMLFIYFVVLVETTGTWFAVSAVTGQELDDNRLNGGAFGEGAGCFLGAILGGTPVTGYSTNAGIIAITGIASRMAIIGGGVVLLVLGMVPKLMSVIACIPGPVISGVFAVICVVISMNGFRVVKAAKLDERNMLVIGLPILFTLAAVFMPEELKNHLPTLVRYLVESGIAVGALAAIVFNLVLPERK